MHDRRTRDRVDGYGLSVGEKNKLPRIDKDKPDTTPDVINKGHDKIEKIADSLDTVADNVGRNRIFINMAWTLLTGFLVMFMQAGFALVGT